METQADLYRAYRAGWIAAKNMDADPFPPKRYSETMQMRWITGWVDYRDAKADAVAKYVSLFPGCKVTLLPFNSSKGDGAFRKAADCA
jgi:hypothetical protein